MKKIALVFCFLNRHCSESKIKNSKKNRIKQQKKFQQNWKIWKLYDFQTSRRNRQNDLMTIFTFASSIEHQTGRKTTIASNTNFLKKKAFSICLMKNISFFVKKSVFSIWDWKRWKLYVKKTYESPENYNVNCICETVETWIVRFD